MFCVNLGFDENEITFNLHSLLTFFEKAFTENTHTSLSLPLYPIVLSISVCSLSKLSQINELEIYGGKACQ